MKVCYVLPKYDEKAGEHVVHKYQLISELAKRCEVTVLIEKCAVVPRFPHVKSVICISDASFLGRSFETLSNLFRLSLQGYKTFYVHYSFFGGILGSIVAKLTGAKVFYWNCGLPHLFFKSFGEKGWLQSKLNDDWPLRVTLSMVDYLVTGTSRMKQYYHEQFGTPLRSILIVPNYIDLKRFKPKRPKNKVPVVLFVHRISERKGAHYIVPIAGRVLKKVNANFLVAGDGPYLPKLQAEIRRKKLSKWVKTLGSIPNKEIMGYYAKADVFLMPSDEEGFPNVLLEAMAVGTPFVASDVGGVRDVVSRGAQRFVVKQGDVGAFTERLVELLSDKKMRDVLSKEGLRHVKQYDLSRVLPVFVKTLRKYSK